MPWCCFFVRLLSERQPSALFWSINFNTLIFEAFLRFLITQDDLKSNTPSDYFPKKRLVTNLVTSWTNFCESLWSLVLPQRREISTLPEALQVLRGEGQVRAAAEGRRVVEQSDERLVKELVVILGWLFVKQRPLVLLMTWKRKTFNAQICTWKTGLP